VFVKGGDNRLGRAEWERQGELTRSRAGDVEAKVRFERLAEHLAMKDPNT